MFMSIPLEFYLFTSLSLSLPHKVSQSLMINIDLFLINLSSAQIPVKKGTRVIYHGSFTPSKYDNPQYWESWACIKDANNSRA